MTRTIQFLVLALLSQHVVVVATDEAATTTEAAPDEKTTAEPTTEAATEAATTEKPTTEEPTTEKPTTEEPATEKPTTKEPATEEPTTTTKIYRNPGVVKTTITSNTYIGDTILKLVNDANFHVGDAIVIAAADPTRTETNTITAVRDEVVDLKSAMQIIHAPGTAVTVKATCHTFAHYYSCPMHYDLPSDPNSVQCLQTDQLPCDSAQSLCCTQSAALCKGHKESFDCGDDYSLKPGANEILCDNSMEQPLKCDTVTVNMTTTPNRDKCCDLALPPGTTLTQEAVPAGAKSMAVGDTEILHVGDAVDIDLGTAVHEVNTIISEVSSARRLSTGSITFGSPLKFAHPSGAKVTVQAPTNPCAPVLPMAAKLYDTKDAASKQQRGLTSSLTFGSMGMLVAGFACLAGLTAGIRAMRKNRSSYLPLSNVDKSLVAPRKNSPQMFARPGEIAEDIYAEVQPLVA